MKRFALLGLLLASISQAGDCPDCAGREGFLARRAAIRAARQTVPTTTKVVTEAAATIKTESVYETRKIGEKITIIPAADKAVKK
jgi:hypothetical protein